MPRHWAGRGGGCAVARRGGLDRGPTSGTTVRTGGSLVPWSLLLLCLLVKDLLVRLWARPSKQAHRDVRMAVVATAVCPRFVLVQAGCTGGMQSAVVRVPCSQALSTVRAVSARSVDADAEGANHVRLRGGAKPRRVLVQRQTQFGQKVLRVHVAGPSKCA